MAKVALLAGVMLMIYVGIAPLAWFWSGSLGPVAAALSAGACLGGAIVALVLGHVFRAPQFALHGVLFGMAARILPPLAVGLACWRHDGPLAQAGVLYYLLIFYPMTLGLETLLSLPAPCSRASQGLDG